MLLAIDIGNTSILVGVMDGARIVKSWRLSTARDRTTDEYTIILKGLFRSTSEEITTSDIDRAIISCVVPSLETVFVGSVKECFKVEPIVIAPGVKTGMPILTDNPREVGADRIVNAVAAYAQHKCALIVVDLGTAATFDYITAKGEYAGGAIAPGIAVSADALFTRAAKLTRVELKRPAEVIGKSTRESLTSGLYYGFTGLVDGIVRRFKDEVGADIKVIATGGSAELIKDASSTIDATDEFLVLKGLEIIDKLNR